MAAMSRPGFLIIGAMKAGTTTLYRDLEDHPQLFLPPEKEPETLVKYGEDDDAIGADYRSLFRNAAGCQLPGEASTAYTKRPDNEGVAARALRVCGSDLKLIFLTREPVARAISHYRHDYGLGFVDEPLVEAFQNHLRYAAYSAYNWQLAPWRECFAPDRLLVLSFEDYVANRVATLERVCAFLGIDPALLPEPIEDRAFNRSDGKPVAKGPVLMLVNSRLYQRFLKPLIPWSFRDWIIHTFLPKARKADARLDAKTEAALRKQIAQYEERERGGD